MHISKVISRTRSQMVVDGVAFVRTSLLPSDALEAAPSKDVDPWVVLRGEFLRTSRVGIGTEFVHVPAWAMCGLHRPWARRTVIIATWLMGSPWWISEAREPRRFSPTTRGVLPVSF